MKKRPTKKTWITLCICTAFLALVIWTIWGNTALMAITGDFEELKADLEAVGVTVELLRIVGVLN